jgi:hypothetical protein
VPATLKTSPLKVALDTGFHSLVELLVRNEESQDVKNRALQHSVSLKRLALIELLVSHCADVGSVPFIEVLYVWYPNIIRYFLDRRLHHRFPICCCLPRKNSNRASSVGGVGRSIRILHLKLQEQSDRDLRWMMMTIRAIDSPSNLQGYLTVEKLLLSGGQRLGSFLQKLCTRELSGGDSLSLLL